MESASFLGHYAEMPDLMRWRFMRHIFELNQPPPQDTFWRCRKHANFAYHTGCPWTSVEMQGDEIVVGTPLGDMRFHFLIVGTGFAIDLRLRPELAAIADKIDVEHGPVGRLDQRYEIRCASTRRRIGARSLSLRHPETP